VCCLGLNAGWGVGVGCCVLIWGGGWHISWYGQLSCFSIVVVVGCWITSFVCFVRPTLSLGWFSVEVSAVHHESAHNAQLHYSPLLNSTPAQSTLNKIFWQDFPPQPSPPPSPSCPTCFQMSSTPQKHILCTPKNSPGIIILSLLYKKISS